MTLLGHNGAGKSTLISYLLGFYTVADQHPFLPHFKALISPLDRSSLGYAPEASYLDESANLENYTTLIASLKGIKNPKIDELLELVSLQVDTKKPIKSYSKGMRQRLMLLLALIGDPQTLVLDEPTSGLDPFGREKIENLILELAKKHKIIISTHSLEFAYKLDQEIWILQSGKVVFRGKFESFDQLKTEFYKHKPDVLL